MQYKQNGSRGINGLILIIAAAAVPNGILLGNSSLESLLRYVSRSHTLLLMFDNLRRAKTGEITHPVNGSE